MPGQVVGGLRSVVEPAEQAPAHSITSPLIHWSVLTTVDGLRAMLGTVTVVVSLIMVTVIGILRAACERVNGLLSSVS